MRGPAYKITGDVRRTWRCPRCGRERKLSGDVTTVECECGSGTLMTIVREKINAPRPIQRPSDIERRPIDFGIEPPPPQITKPEATIIKPAVEADVVQVVETIEVVETNAPSEPPEVTPSEPEEEWGEGIL